MSASPRRRAPSAPRPADIGLPDEPSPVGQDDTHVRHVQARVDEQLRALLAHQDGARDGTDPDELHQYRVAIRRLRSVLKTSPMFGADGETVRTELRWIGGLTGPVRDLDVLLMRLRDEITDFDDADRAAAETLISAFAAERSGERRKVRRAFSGARYAKLLRAVAGLATRPESELDDAAAASNVEGTQLVGSLRKPYKRLAKAVDALGQDPPDGDLHALRIHSKRLRYAAETALPSAHKSEAKRLKAVVKASKRLQDILGSHQDAVVAAERIRALLDGAAGVEPRVAYVAGRIVEREHIRRSLLREQWPDVWRRVTDATAPLL